MVTRSSKPPKFSLGLREHDVGSTRLQAGRTQPSDHPDLARGRWNSRKKTEQITIAHPFIPEYGEAPTANWQSRFSSLGKAGAQIERALRR
jgi:hypothetical protein